MEFNISRSIQILERTPIILREMLSGLDEEWTHSNEGQETWSAYDIVGHYIHGEKTDWIPRARIILEADNKEFEAFDRFAQLKDSLGKTLEELINEFEELRAANIDALKAMGITDEDLPKSGIHPEFGKVTLKELLATWVAHDLNHIAQISRVIAKQYKSEVGPWKEYMRILNT